MISYDQHKYLQTGKSFDINLIKATFYLWST